MTKQQLLRWALEKIERYCQETTPTERFDELVARGVIDKDGKVLISWGGEKDGWEAAHGQDEQEEKEPDTPL